MPCFVLVSHKLVYLYIKVRERLKYLMIRLGDLCFNGRWNLGQDTGEKTAGGKNMLFESWSNALLKVQCRDRRPGGICQSGRREMGKV